MDYWASSALHPNLIKLRPINSVIIFGKLACISTTAYCTALRGANHWGVSSPCSPPLASAPDHDDEKRKAPEREEVRKRKANADAPGPVASSGGDVMIMIDDIPVRPGSSGDELEW
jgi:hypothetical protein